MRRLFVGAWLALCGLVLASSGCLLVSDHAHDSAVYTTIDADHVLDTVPGEGAALFVEYRSGGTWRLWTTCDTLVSGHSCDFEAHLTASSSIGLVDEIGLEFVDEVRVFEPNALSFYAHTTTQTDAVEFTTAPGAAIEVELLLDGYVAPSYFVWFAAGVVHDGAHGSPVVFEPNTP